MRLGSLILLAAAPLAVGTATSQASTGAPGPQARLAPSHAFEGEASAAEPPSEGEETIFELATTNEGGEEEESGSTSGEGKDGSSGEAGEGTGEPASGGEASRGEGEEEAEDEGESVSASDRRGSHHETVKLSALRLLPGTREALGHGRVGSAGIGFAFSLSARTKVRVSLSRQARRGTASRWVALPDPVSLSATRGTNRDHLFAGFHLSPGSYRMTVTPARGHSHYLQLRVK